MSNRFVVFGARFVYIYHVKQQYVIQHENNLSFGVSRFHGRVGVARPENHKQVRGQRIN